MIIDKICYSMKLGENLNKTFGKVLVTNLNDGRCAGRIGDGVWHRLVEDEKIKFYQMMPNITIHNRDILSYE